MVWLREIWAGVRETVFVAAQVVTLGVLALVLGLIALNVLTHRPPSSTRAAASSEPSRPLSALVPTLVPDTPTPGATAAPAAPAEPTATPPATATPRPPEPTAAATAPPAAVGTASPVPPTATPAPEATPRPVEPSPTSAVPGQLIKVLPAADGLPARVRAEPSARAPILVRVPLGATVESLGTTSGEELQPGNPTWVRIRWKGTTGYVYSTLVGAP